MTKIKYGLYNYTDKTFGVLRIVYISGFSNGCKLGLYSKLLSLKVH